MFKLGYFMIQSRWPAWSKWHIVQASPHSERLPFDPYCGNALCFESRESAEDGANALRRSNDGEFRVIEMPSAIVARAAYHKCGCGGLCDPGEPCAMHYNAPKFPD